MNLLLQNAIIELSKSTSVDEWNQIRSTYVKKLNKQELYEIDGKGLIVKTLGVDEDCNQLLNNKN